MSVLAAPAAFTQGGGPAGRGPPGKETYLKLVALGEVGELPEAEILEAQPLWARFMVWSSWLVTDNTPERVKEIYAHRRALTHDGVTRPE